MNTQNSQERVPLDLSLATDILCSECGSKIFQPVLLFKKISAIVSPNGEEIIIPIETCICVKCGNINDEFNPEKNQNRKS
jgi:DNA-directed RNA polymerase subunit RPC12/RpoP